MASNTSTIGAIGEMAVSSHLLSLGYDVYKEITGSGAVDLVASKSGRWLRVQVKTCRTVRGGIGVSRMHSGRQIKKRIEGHEYDVIAVYVRDKNVCLFVSMETILQSKNGILIRLERAKNNQQKRIHWFEDFLQLPT